MAYQKRSSLWVFFHALLPSAASLIGGMLFALLIMGLHLLLLSRQPDLFLPHFAGAANDQLAKVYSSSILGPLDNAFGNSAFGVLSTAVVWGFFGWAVYGLLDFVIGTVNDLRSSGHDINIQTGERVVRHPLHRQMVIRLSWRFLVGMLVIVATLALQPLVSELFDQDIALLRSASASDMLSHLGLALLGWAVVCHIYVVLLRLFVLRTRLTGEILY